MKILVINGGSSSFKFTVYEGQNNNDHLEVIWKKEIEFKETSSGRRELIQDVLKEVPQPIERIGHRAVHGGVLFQKTTKIDLDVEKKLQELNSIAPLHNPINLEGIELAKKFFPQIIQVAVFDTAFHATLPEVAWTYPGPWEWRNEGIRRYGFHGISHQYCSEKIQELLGYVPDNLINCHLGNGCSCTAIKKGKSIETSMGFTPMEGLMMGTRSGSIDPGILLYLEREKKWTEKDLDYCLNKQSGLLGIAGSFDMRQILKKMRANDTRAKLAVDMYVYRLKKTIGELTTVLGGVDVLSFTAGIGENVPEIRFQTGLGLNYLGLKIDEKKNATSELEISSDESKVKVFVIRTQENWLIARETFNLRF